MPNRLRLLLGAYGPALFVILFGVGFTLIVLVLAWLEQRGLSQRWIGYTFLFLTLLVFSMVGLFTRTSDVAEYFVAGRRVPAVYSGMSSGTDWLSAASFIGLAGALYQSGYQGLAFVIGWTGGYVLLALLMAPYLRKFGQYTLPDFLAARYGGQGIRLIGALAVILASLIYVVAQVYGVGLITSRFITLQFEIGVYLGLAGVLVCTFLGGMRALLHAQAAQYVILLIAYITPITILSFDRTGIPAPPVLYAKAMHQLVDLENEVFNRPEEVAVRALYAERADRLASQIEKLPGSLAAERTRLSDQIERMKSTDASVREIVQVERERRSLPATPQLAHAKWRDDLKEARHRSEPPVTDLESFALPEEGNSRANFLALIFCLTIGTASLPHLLMRYYSIASVSQARRSVFWSLFFVALVYLLAPAYAVFVKLEVLQHTIGVPVESLPAWVNAWTKIGLVSIDDINHDHLLQWAELTINPDVIVLATPEIAGLPYVISGMVAAGGLAAALSTAEGLLLSITSALSHDIYFKMLRPDASSSWRLIVSKSVMVGVAILAASIAVQRPASIVDMVAWAFSVAGSALFPALVLGVFWPRANCAGALAGMIAGLAVTIFYIARVEFDSIPLMGWYGIGMNPWFGIDAAAAGIYGVPVGLVTNIVVSLLTKPPGPESQQFIERLRYPRILYNRDASPVRSPDA
jgi:cation/acetate symporter